MTRPLRRCALYTRKSTEEGLEQDFNSLDAQREACAAYVTSQASQGWRAIRTPYDDGGYSGGTMERPALKALLADIEAGKVDVVVVYKIDRLSRSLMDFARLVEVFDRHDVTFVSVTQAFNTTSSMGRLTLNVLLSFAQFEREVTGERIRDKIAASKARGMWMGGVPPLGYDLPAPDSRALVVNPEDADTVRTIFRTYLELGSVHALRRRLVELGIRSKRRTTRKGRTVGGTSFDRGALFHLLRNRTYLGMIVHKNQVHPGMHPAIVDADLFEAVQSGLERNRRRRSKQEQVARAPLTGRIVDCDGHPMSPAVAHGKSGKRYRYYVSAPLQRGHRPSADDRGIRRVAAGLIETKLIEILGRLLPDRSSDPLGMLNRVEVHAEDVHLLLPVRLLPTVGNRLAAGENAERDDADRTQLRLVSPMRMKRRGGRTHIIASAAPTPSPDPVLIRALRAAHQMLQHDPAGLPVLTTAPASPYLRRLVRLAFLAPDLQRAILAGRQPPGLTLSQMLEAPVPLSWSQQARAIGIAAPVIAGSVADDGNPDPR